MPRLPFVPFLLSLLFLLSMAVSLPAARAAASYDNCTGFVTTLPATIATQGVWCLKQDLSTAITSGNAIAITANNVTLDCNGFKLGGLAAGAASTATGIGSSRLNLTIRNCSVRGFRRGISLVGVDSGGHLVEDNRLDGNLHTGIQVGGERNRVQRNVVVNTGGAPGQAFSYGIEANADVVDNTVSGVFATAVNTQPTGVRVLGDGSEVRGNRVRGLLVAGTGAAIGIDVDGSHQVIDGNRISALVATPGRGIAGNGTANTFCTGNTVANFTLPLDNCDDVGGNASH
ncbi:MAG TPA: right-handed parallel beta-helix repeat-containing protein [Lysobacter sp.]